jgi:hypothetical protein
MFSKLLVAYHWFNTDDPTGVGSVLKTVKALEIDRIPQAYQDKYMLKNMLYFTMPQLLAFDFYISMRDAMKGGRYVNDRRKVFNETITKIIALPEGGWDVAGFRVILIRPYKCADVICILGSAFDVIDFPARRKVASHIFEYRGSDFVKKVKTVQEQTIVYGQVTQDGIYWGVRTRLEREHWKKWRKIPFEYKKK